MAIRFDSVTVLCDACDEGRYRATAETSAALANGQLRVLRPPGWSEAGPKLICPTCAEARALEKVDQAEVPDPTNDPEPLRKTREERLDSMKEVVRADLEEREAEFPELREYVRQIMVKDGDMPDFLGHVGDAKVEVKVRSNYVEISWPGAQSMTLTLQHDDLKLVNPPLFMDAKVVEWVQNCLQTMAPDEVKDEPDPVKQ